MYIYVHQHIYIYICIYIYKNIYIYICYIYICIYIYILRTYEAIKSNYAKCIFCITFKLDKMVLIKLPIDTC